MLLPTLKIANGERGATAPKRSGAALEPKGSVTHAALADAWVAGFGVVCAISSAVAAMCTPGLTPFSVGFLSSVVAI
jgi:hypothetical protein